MKEKQWVQHISGQGEKWEVQSDCVGYWIVYRGTQSVDTLLTKLDYVLCEPPEVWRDVTERIEPSSTPGNWRDPQLQCTVLGVDESSYRLRKVQLLQLKAGLSDAQKGQAIEIATNACEAQPQWAFLVEQKVTQ